MPRPQSKPVDRRSFRRRLGERVRDTAGVRIETWNGLEIGRYQPAGRETVSEVRSAHREAMVDDMATDRTWDR